MTNFFERDPIRDIVDINTFNGFLQEYCSSVLQNTPQGKAYLKRQEQQREQFESRNGIKLPPETLPLSTHVPIAWKNIPWEQIPQNIQEMFLLHYKERTLEERVVDINLPYDRKSIYFILRSPHVSGMFDTYREAVAGGLGLQLVDEVSGSLKRSKANWYFGQRSVKKLMGIMRAGENLEGGITEEKTNNLRNALRDFEKETEVRPVSLTQLKDIASIIVKHRDKVVFGYGQDT